MPAALLAQGQEQRNTHMEPVGFIGMIIIGLLAGWIAEKATKSSHGLFLNLAVGLIGAVVGGVLARMVGITYGGFLGTLVVATVGAVVLLWLVRLIRG